MYSYDLILHPQTTISLGPITQSKQACRLAVRVIQFLQRFLQLGHEKLPESAIPMGATRKYGRCSSLWSEFWGVLYLLGLWPAYCLLLVLPK
jgi:hypothetical protein